MNKIYIRRNCGAYEVYCYDLGRKYYVGYTKKEALKRYKEHYGIKHKRGFSLVDLS